MLHSITTNRLTQKTFNYISEANYKLHLNKNISLAYHTNLTKMALKNL